MSDRLPPASAESERIAQYVASVLGMTLPPESVEGVAANYCLLLTHWAVFGVLAKEPE